MISFDSDIANYMESTSDGLDGFDKWLTDEPSDEDDVYHATWEEAEQAARETVERFKQYAAETKELEEADIRW